MDINVVIVEDQKDTRNMLAMLISGSAGYSCMDTFENAEDAIINIPILQPDVVLMDIHLPGQSGIACVTKLKLLLPAVQFIMCTYLEDAESVFNALKAGASGYISKSTPPAKILEAIEDVHHGGSPMSSQVARKVVAFFHQENEAKGKKELQKLSDREQEILHYLSKGYRYKEIAGLLYISIETVRKHIHNIYEKLQVNSRIDALNKTVYKK